MKLSPYVSIVYEDILIIALIKSCHGNVLWITLM